MPTKSEHLRRLMQSNEHVVRLEKYITTTGIDYRHDLDSAFDAVGISPRLMVPELSSPHLVVPELSFRFSGPQGSVLHIPIHISRRVGGRQSLFTLGPGKEIVAGIYKLGDKVFERRVTKSKGTDDLRVGDEFTERITDVAGAEVQMHAYKVSAIGLTAGSIYLESMTEDDGPETGDLVNTGDGWCWFCNYGSVWWCGFPCLPGEFGDIFV